MGSMELELKTKEETMTFLHEMLEWLVPVKEQLENTQISEFSMGEFLYFINVTNALDDLEVALSELDQITDI